MKLMLLRGKKYFILVVTTAMLFTVVAISSRVSAQTHSSSNYRVDESAFSTGSSTDANSSSYNARVSAGDNAVGNANSSNFQTYAGPISPDQEYVELVIPATTVNMGVISPGTPGTGTATFTARAYLNSDYVIITPREPPTSEGGSVIDAMTAATTFNANVEQFGMNLVANTSPVTQGANPSPHPNGSFAYGEAATGYDTPNTYKYDPGDVIAESTTRGYGETDFTISYLLNITPTTPAGTYRMEQDLVITATY